MDAARSARPGQRGHPGTAAKHSFIDGYQLRFTGSTIGLFDLWIRWFLLSVVTLGIYLFWVGPRIEKWTWEHTDVA